MKKIILYTISMLLLSFETYSNTATQWRSKPVLCGETNIILNDLISDNFMPIGESIITENETGKKIGFTWFFKKNNEILIVENYDNVSCIINISKNYTPLTPINL